MVNLKDIKMKPKLIGLFLIVGLIPLALVGFMASNLATSALMEKSYNQLESVREIKKAQIEKYFAERKGDMGVLVETVDTLRQEAFSKLEAIQSIKKAQLMDYIGILTTGIHSQKDIPYTWTVIEEFKRAGKPGTASWNSLARKYDPYYKEMIEENGWYDYFLISPEGRIVYTVTRESDLGMSIPNSELRDSGIGQAFKEAQRMGEEDVAIGDIAPYSPSNGAPAGFMMGRIVADGKFHGYNALQIPIEKINNIMLRRDGMGKTGETYLVGQDGLMRSDSYLDPKGHSVEASMRNREGVDTEATRSALAGNAGQDVIIDYNGNPVLSAWHPVELGNGVRWAMISEIDVAEAFSPVDENGNEYYKKYADMYGYYDLFLINPDGYIFYTVAREADYQTNIVNGKFSSSNLGKLVREVLQSKRYGMADFEPYEPSNGEPAAFIAQPVLHEGGVEAIVALQPP
ncbi:hypothetical protein LCGC14_2494200, partial [marine sediment metagenome]